MAGYIATFTVLLTLCTQVLAQGVTPTMEVILKQTLATDGVLTEKMHREFWREINKSGSNKGNSQATELLESSIILAQEYQKEVWESAKISYQNREVIKTKRLIELETELPARYQQSLPYPKDSAEYRAAMAGYQTAAVSRMENTRRLLQSAAAHRPLTIAEGQTVTVDMPLIHGILSNLSAGFTRLRNLLDENWIPG